MQGMYKENTLVLGSLQFNAHKKSETTELTQCQSIYNAVYVKYWNLKDTEAFREGRDQTKPISDSSSSSQGLHKESENP